MKTNRTTFSPRFRKTWLASLLIPLFSPIHSWAAQTISVTDGTTVPISGEYGTDAEYQPAVVMLISVSRPRHAVPMVSI